MQIENVTLLKQIVLSADCRVMRFASKTIAPQVKPGQFIHLRVADGNEFLLRRPFSVFKADRESLAILYKVVGNGTRLLSEMRPGGKASIIGPLGNGFPMPSAGVQPLLIAGGYGSAALYLLAERAAQKGTILIGGESKSAILCKNEFARLGWKVSLATEDGSVGRKGLVTDLLKERLAARRGAGKVEVYACGPMGMLRTVADIARNAGLKAWLSLDRHLGCGVGACLACVQKVRIPSGKGAAEEKWKWARICTEGPVFECREILWGNAE